MSGVDMDATGDNDPTGLTGAGLLTDTQVVFQCESCRSVLGDATNWVAATEALETFTLNAVTDVIVIGDKFHHSTHEHDAGSSYSLLTCRCCNTELGRRYITTPSHLDFLRDNFTLHVAMVTSYQLGSAGIKVVPKFQGQEPPMLLKVAERCVKMQHVIVTMYERLSSIEKCLQGDEENSNH